MRAVACCVRLGWYSCGDGLALHVQHGGGEPSLQLVDAADIQAALVEEVQDVGGGGGGQRRDGPQLLTEEVGGVGGHGSCDDGDLGAA